MKKINESKVFFDTNIWIFIYCEIANSNRFKVNKYSRAFSTLRRSGNPIFTDITIISEFVNRYLRIAYYNYLQKEDLKQKDCDFKRGYRITSDFSEAWKNVCNIVNNRILPFTEIINIEYNRKSLGELLDPLIVDTDFNDTHIINLCKVNNMHLLTDDGDFKNSGIRVISENQKYWRH